MTVTESGLWSTRLGALVLLVVIAAVGFQPFFLHALRINRAIATRQYDELPYRRLPGLQQICEDVRRLVPRGSKVALETPYPGWWEGYSFSYMRASYLLADYRLVPLVDARDRAQPEVLGEVDWVLVIGGVPERKGFEVAAVSESVLLMRRAR